MDRSPVESTGFPAENSDNGDDGGYSLFESGYNSGQHGLSSALFSHHNQPMKSQLMPLFTSEELQEFEHEGYAIVRGLAEPAICEQMLSVTQDHLAREVEPIEFEADVQYPGAPESLDARGGRTARRLKQAHARDYCFTQWLTNPQLVGRLTQLLGQRVIMPLAHHNCIMTKQPRFSSDTGWHQDIRYWGYQRPELVSVWLALGSENLDNGCLQLIPATHRMSFRPEQLDEEIFLRDDVPENQDLIETKVYAELEQGDVLFFHARTFHSATRNYTTATKYSAVFTFRGNDNAPRPGSRTAQHPELILPEVSGRRDEFAEKTDQVG